MKNLTKPIMMALLLSLILAGCSKINQENYDKIKIGMDYQQVIEIIGNPDRCDAVLGAKSCIWGNEKKNITINFVADKVALPTMKGL
jgi:hypothetical protein